MNNLTQDQKAQAFDILLKWLSDTAGEMQKKVSKEWNETAEKIYQAKADVLDTAAAMAVEIASQIATTEQAENMPPAGLDLSKHVGQTAVLWSGYKDKIERNNNDFSYDFPVRVGTKVLTNNGFYEADMSPCDLNIKTILPC